MVIVASILPIATLTPLNLSCVPAAYESAQNLHRADGAYVGSHTAETGYQGVVKHSCDV